MLKNKILDCITFFDNNFTKVVLPAPEGEESMIITPSFFEGIEISS